MEARTNSSTRRDASRKSFPRSLLGPILLLAMTACPAPDPPPPSGGETGQPPPPGPSGNVCDQVEGAGVDDTAAGIDEGECPETVGDALSFRWEQKRRFHVVHEQSSIFLGATNLTAYRIGVRYEATGRSLDGGEVFRIPMVDATLEPQTGRAAQVDLDMAASAGWIQDGSVEIQVSAALTNPVRTPLQEVLTAQIEVDVEDGRIKDITYEIPPP